MSHEFLPMMGVFWCVVLWTLFIVGGRCCVVSLYCFGISR